MRTPVLLTTALAATLLLSSCAPSSTPDSRDTPTPSPTISQPAFLAAAQLDADILPTGIANTLDIADDSTRLQGEWDAHEVFLGLKGGSTVCLITGTAEAQDSWVAACGTGDGVVTWKAPDGGVVKYLPVTSSTTPQGWTRLSDHVFAM